MLDSCSNILFHFTKWKSVIMLNGCSSHFIDITHNKRPLYFHGFYHIAFPTLESSLSQLPQRPDRHSGQLEATTRSTPALQSIPPGARGLHWPECRAGGGVRPPARCRRTPPRASAGRRPWWAAGRGRWRHCPATGASAATTRPLRARRQSQLSLEVTQRLAERHGRTRRRAETRGGDSSVSLQYAGYCMLLDKMTAITFRISEARRKG